MNDIKAVKAAWAGLEAVMNTKPLSDVEQVLALLLAYYTERVKAENPESNGVVV